mmetsp:Transcript_27887/g.64029  ORF Transcript_27887/g.64029 Transcript_27887/m.64029 type:complete len:174 (+) Transcript_27887:2320-2841(+)
MATDDADDSATPAAPSRLMSDIPTPSSYAEAMNGRYAARWREAMTEEIKSLQEHGTWELIERSKLPSRRKPTKSKWVFRVKLNRDGSVERFKARFVVCGYSQVQGVDYTHCFSATLRSTSVRLLLALAAGLKLRLHHFDVKSAFTQSDIDHEIYVDPPADYVSRTRLAHLCLF